MAITWQNVYSPNNAGILNVMQDQSRLVSQGFNDLAGVVNDVGVQKDDARVQNLMNKLQSFKTVDEVKAFEASDEYAQLTGGIVRNENQGKVRGSIDARAQGLRELITGENTFADNISNREQTNNLKAINNPVAIQNAEALAALAPLNNQTAAVNATTGFKEALFKEQNIDQTQSDAVAKSANTRLTTEADAVTLKETAANKPYEDKFTAAIAGKDYASAKTLIDSLQGPAKANALVALQNAQIADATTQRNLTVQQQTDLANNEASIVGLNNKIATINESTAGSQTGQSAIAKLVGDDPKKKAAISELFVKYPQLADLPIAKALTVVQKNMAGFDEWFTSDRTVQAKIKADLDNEIKLNAPFIEANKSSLAQYNQGLERLKKEGDRQFNIVNPGLAAQSAAIKANQDLITKQTQAAKVSLKETAKPTAAVLNQREAETKAQLDIALVDAGQKKELSPATLKFRESQGNATIDNLFGKSSSSLTIGLPKVKIESSEEAARKNISKLQNELKKIQDAKKSK